MIYKKRYSVTVDGTVTDLKKDRILPKSLSYNGYLKVCINRSGTLIHRILAELFIPNPNNFKQVNHKNGIKTDNRIENLEWCNNRYNVSEHYLKIKTSSKYTGVSFHKGIGKWQAQIKIKGKNVHLGYFKNEIDGKNAYDNKLKILQE